MPVVINGDTGITQSGEFDSDSSFGYKNRLINPGMVIDQRNAGASVTINGSANFYGVDRFFGTGQSADGVFTLQQSTTAPTGFRNSLIATVTTADASLGATQQYLVGQNIEGFNVADLGWGAAGAQTVTLSFWVRSSLTGTFGGSIVNSGFNRSYPFSYTISAANTFEYKTVTIAGDTSGTWLTDNGVGLRLLFSLGAGASYLGTAGSWSGSYLAGATGQTQVISTNGATFYITGVQLEKGSTATSFDFRPYGTELMLCQRYYIRYATNGMYFANGHLNSTTQYDVMGTFPVTMRSAPTGTALNVGNIQIKLTGGGNQSITNVTAFGTNVFGFRAYGDMPSTSATGYGCFLYSNADGRGFEFSAEL